MKLSACADTKPVNEGWRLSLAANSFARQQLMNSMLEILRQHKIIAIARGISLENASAVAQLLFEGGVRLAEVTLNTPDALQIIERWRAEFPEMHIGAGTVLDVESAQQAISARAQFLVTPNTDERVIEYSHERQTPIFPGAMTPSEIVRAWQAGATAIKVFPASSLGANYFKEVRGPLPQIPLVAVGGVNENNLRDFLGAGAIGVGLGGSLVNLKLIENNQFDELRDLARRCVEATR
jgi:2-dehydro-3-deoxyphosphogluconate aldolase / (4S)-4-hydroxy-2-oxoglutarate aldolase